MATAFVLDQLKSLLAGLMGLVIVLYLLNEYIHLHQNKPLAYDLKREVYWESPDMVSPDRESPDRTSPDRTSPDRTSLKDESPGIPQLVLGTGNIGNQVWDFNFTDIESLFWPFLKNNKGVEVVEPTTLLLNLIELASNKLPENLTAIQVQRIRLLFRHSFSLENGTRLANWVFAYHAYQATLNELPQSQNLEAMVALQTRYFGESDAPLLFAKRNLNQGFIFELQTINNNGELSVEQRRLKVDRLRLQFQQSLERLNGE